MNIKTYLAVGELVQRAAHFHGLTGPVQFTVCGPRPVDIGDSRSQVAVDNAPEIDRPPAIERVDDFFYAQHTF